MIDIFIMLILSIHEHGRSFHFLISSSFPFFEDLNYCHIGLSLLWLELPQDIFLLSVAIVKDDAFLIFQPFYNLYMEGIQIFFS